jgi:hypothetical protein
MACGTGKTFTRLNLPAQPLTELMQESTIPLLRDLDCDPARQSHSFH